MRKAFAAAIGVAAVASLAIPTLSNAAAGDGEGGRGRQRRLPRGRSHLVSYHTDNADEIGNVMDSGDGNFAFNL